MIYFLYRHNIGKRKVGNKILSKLERKRMKKMWLYYGRKLIQIFWKSEIF
jgi:hypothetical protein